MSSPPRLAAVSAIGAGLILAATPHCGGKSVGPSDDSSDGGARTKAGGAAGSAGYGGSGTGAGAYGGNGGTGTSPYGGSYGGQGTGGYGGSYGGSVGVCPTVTECYVPEELRNCFPDAGIINVDAGVDSGIGGTTGEGGFAGEASEPPPPMAVPPSGDEAIPDSGAGIPVPPYYSCPVDSPFPFCVAEVRPLPPYSYVSLQGWNGTSCCYTFYICYL